VRNPWPNEMPHLNPLLLTILLLLTCGLACCKDKTVPAAPERAVTYAVVIQSLNPEFKIRAIKAVREETGLGLAAAKTLVESLPQTLKSGLTKTEADALVQKLDASGMKAEAQK
jgi:ribosomal protein L7/L12